MSFLQEVNSQVGDPDKLSLMRTTAPVVVSDIIVWKRTVYDYEVYRFLGMSRKCYYVCSIDDGPNSGPIIKGTGHNAGTNNDLNIWSHQYY